MKFTVTAAAMRRQKSIVQKIRDSRADYVTGLILFLEKVSKRTWAAHALPDRSLGEAQ